MNPRIAGLPWTRLGPPHRVVCFTTTPRVIRAMDLPLITGTAQ
jgi:hypothetical protein